MTTTQFIGRVAIGIVSIVVVVFFASIAWKIGQNTIK